jgi:hypothetical protein
LHLPPGVEVPPLSGAGTDPKSLPGLVLDDSEAKLIGSWQNTGSLTGFVGQGYQYSSDKNAKAVFDFKIANAGLYEVRIAWQAHENRAKQARIIIRSASQVDEVTVNQTRPPNGEKSFQSLGKFTFRSGQPASVEFWVNGSQGIVHIDAVSLVPVASETQDSR